MSKTKSITLSYPHYDTNAPSVEERMKKHNLLYRVERVAETTEYPPGSLLKKSEVDAICANSGWNVTLINKKD